MICAVCAVAMCVVRCVQRAMCSASVCRVCRRVCRVHMMLGVCSQPLCTPARHFLSVTSVSVGQCCYCFYKSFSSSCTQHVKVCKSNCIEVKVCKSNCIEVNVRFASPIVLKLMCIHRLNYIVVRPAIIYGVADMSGLSTCLFIFLSKRTQHIFSWSLEMLRVKCDATTNECVSACWPFLCLPKPLR